jgi:hypothetical protein
VGPQLLDVRHQVPRPAHHAASERGRGIGGLWRTLLESQGHRPFLVERGLT